jgi:hypothetical protein
MNILSEFDTGKFLLPCVAQKAFQSSVAFGVLVGAAIAFTLGLAS